MYHIYMAEQNQEGRKTLGQQMHEEGFKASPATEAAMAKDKIQPQGERRTLGQRMAETDTTVDPDVANFIAEARTRKGAMRGWLEKAVQLTHLDKYRKNLSSRIDNNPTSQGVEPVHTRSNDADQQILGENNEQNKVRQQQLKVLKEMRQG